MRQGPSLNESRQSVAQQVNGADASPKQALPKTLDLHKSGVCAQSVSYQRLCRFTQEKRPSNFDGLRYACLALLLVRLSVPLSHPTAHLGDRKQSLSNVFLKGQAKVLPGTQRKRVLFSGEGSILIWKADQKVQALVKDAGTNGLLFDHEGRLLTCEPLHRRVRRLESDGSGRH